MKKILVAGVAAAALAVPPSAFALTHAQQDAAIRRLNAKMACLVRFPVAQFGDYAAYTNAQGVNTNAPVYTEVDSTNPDSLTDNGAVTGLDFVFGFHPHAWMIGIKNTVGCRAKFAKATKPAGVARPASAQFKARMLARVG
jgi:hypothetical protein